MSDGSSIVFTSNR
jgi:hypothetical protein